jgi:hypothetical protein
VIPSGNGEQVRTEKWFETPFRREGEEWKLPVPAAWPMPSPQRRCGSRLPPQAAWRVSRGGPTLWLADAVRANNGHLTSVEIEPDRSFQPHATSSAPG